MNARHRARRAAIQFLYQREFGREGDARAAWSLFWDSDRLGEEALSPALRAFAEQRVQGVEEHLGELDARLQAYAEHWSLARMALVDLNIMRLALYEMLHCPDTPPVVSVNEALDAAHELSGREAARFINGILDRALRDLDRPLREAARVPRQEPGS